MLRSLVGLVLLAGAATFAYFFFTNPPAATTGERARKALSDTGEAVVDQGLAAAVHVRLASGAGVDAARFLHVYNHDGSVVVYGLLPGSLTAEQLTTWAREVPGVKQVEVLVVPRPAHVPMAEGAEPTPPPADGASAGGG